MKVRDVMTKGAECVTPSTILQDAARKMKNLDVRPAQRNQFRRG